MKVVTDKMRQLYGRGLGSQCYLTCLHASCNVATFNVWLFNAWYSCFNSNLSLLHSISSFCNLASVHLTFVLRPCRIFILQWVMPFFVLPLFILRPAIILSSSCHHCFVYANCNYTSRWRFTRTTKFVCTSEAPSGCIIAVSIDEAMMVWRSKDNGRTEYK